MKLHSYLTFNGNCRQAMTFYQACLGGELFFQTVGESLLTAPLPARMRDSILHASLTRGGLVLMASDMVGEQGRIIGNAVSMMLHCSSEEEIRACYEKLSAGGRRSQGLEPTFRGALFGGLTDKYGNPWLLHFQPGLNDLKP